LTVTAETALGLVAAKPANVRNTKDKDKGQQDSKPFKASVLKTTIDRDEAGDAPYREKRDDFKE
jgi:hypothetical protein